MTRFRHVLSVTPDHTQTIINEETHEMYETLSHERRESNDSNGSSTWSPGTPSPKSSRHARIEPFQSLFYEDTEDESIKIENNRNTPLPKLNKQEKVVWDLKAKRRREYDALLRSAGIEPDEDDHDTDQESDSETAELPNPAQTNETLEALRKRWAEKLALDDGVYR